MHEPYLCCYIVDGTTHLDHQILNTYLKYCYNQNFTIRSSKEILDYHC